MKRTLIFFCLTWMTCLGHAQITGANPGEPAPYEHRDASSGFLHNDHRSVAAANATVNVTTYGALGSGMSHPACSTLSGVTTLAQLKAYSSGIFSFATACTNQVDWLAAQHAVNLLAGKGGSVFFPHGTYLFDQPLVLPLSYNGSGTSTAVYLEGEGRGGTFIQPSVSDFGAGSALVSCGPINSSWADNSKAGSGRYAQLSGCFGGIDGITFNNPYGTTTTNVTSTAYSPSNVINVPAPSYNGGAPIQMDGIKIGARMNLNQVSVYGFRMAFNVVGDHMHWTDVTAEHNYCGYYLAPPSIYLFGDIILDGLNSFDGNYLAGICVDKDAIVSMYQQGELYLGYQPYGMLKFAGTADSYGESYGGSVPPMIDNATFDIVQSESLGNAWIWDDSLTNTAGTVNATGTGTIQSLAINNLFTSWDSSAKLTKGGRGSFAYLGMQFVSGLTIRTLNIGGMAPGATGQLDGFLVHDTGYDGGGIDIGGELNDVLTAYSKAGYEFVGGFGAFNSHCQHVTLHYPGMWSGGEIPIPTAGSVPAIGSALQLSSYGATLATATAPVMGIAMSNTKNAGGGQCIVYADNGFVPVKTTSAPTANSMLVTSTNGTAVAKTTAGGYVVGIVSNAAAGTSIVKITPGGFIP